MSGRGSSQAELLLQLADRAGYWYGTSTRGEPFAATLGESIVRPLRGGRGSTRAQLARMFAEEQGRAPSANALADAMLALEGRCYAGEERELHLRVARTAEAVWLDLGTPDGDLIKVTPDGWRIMHGGGPLFRRTRLTGALPKPAPGGDVGELRTLLRVGDDVWPLIVAWLLSVLLLPCQPVPVLALTGEQGTAKSWQSRLLVTLVDPSDSPLRTAPRDVESWAVAAAASRVVALDNVSRVEPWLSDALCRAVTGDGLIRRALYTDHDVSVIAFRRACLLNGITLGGLRGDLADRLIRVELEQLDDADRKDEADLAARWEQAHPVALGGLLDLAAAVLATLPTVTLDRRPRMADYARVLAAADQVLGTGGLSCYLGQRGQIAAEVVESDKVAAAIADLAVKLTGPWEGTAAELLTLLRPADAGDTWPATGQGMSARLARVAPALRATGTSITQVTSSREPGRRHEPQRWRVGRGAGEQIAGGCPRSPDVPASSIVAGQTPNGSGDILGTSSGHLSPGREDVPGMSPGIVAGQAPNGDMGTSGTSSTHPLHLPLNGHPGTPADSAEVTALAVIRDVFGERVAEVDGWPDGSNGAVANRTGGTP